MRWVIEDINGERQRKTTCTHILDAISWQSQFARNDEIDVVAWIVDAPARFSFSTCIAKTQVPKIDKAGLDLTWLSHVPIRKYRVK